MSGHIQAQFNVGLKYEKGEGTSVDKEKAIYWYTLAAFNQDDNAQFRLASLLQKETGKAKESHFWYEKSAELGNPEAHLALATNLEIREYADIIESSHCLIATTINCLGPASLIAELCP